MSPWISRGHEIRGPSGGCHASLHLMLLFHVHRNIVCIGITVYLHSVWIPYFEPRIAQFFSTAARVHLLRSYGDWRDEHEKESQLTGQQVGVRDSGIRLRRQRFLPKFISCQHLIPFCQMILVFLSLSCFSSFSSRHLVCVLKNIPSIEARYPVAALQNIQW